MPTNSHTKWVEEDLLPGAKLTEYGTEHLPALSAHVKNEQIYKYTSAPTHAFMAWCLLKCRELLPSFCKHKAPRFTECYSTHYS